MRDERFWELAFHPAGCNSSLAHSSFVGLMAARYGCRVHTIQISEILNFCERDSVQRDLRGGEAVTVESSRHLHGSALV